MRFREIPSMRKTAIFYLFICSISSSATSLAADGDEIIRDLTERCESLAKDMAQKDKKFPQAPIQKIEGLMTWHAAVCGERPNVNGTVIALCDGHLGSGGDIFFWQMRTKDGEFKNGLSICK